MSEPTIDEMLAWLKDVGLLAVHYDAVPQRVNDANYHAIRAILEQRRDAVIISKSQRDASSKRLKGSSKPAI